MKNKLKDIKKEKDDSLRKISSKNYIILIIIFIITLGLVFGLRNWYLSYKDYQLTIPILKGKINEVTDAELDSFLTENTDAIMYIEVSEEANSRAIAKDLYKVIKNRNLTERTVYLNLSSNSNREKFLNDFSKKYIDNGKITNYPALILFNDGKVQAFVSKSNNQDLNIGDIEQMFDEYEVEGD